MAWALPIFPLGVLVIYPQDTGARRPSNPVVLIYASLGKTGVSLGGMFLVHAVTHAVPAPGLPYTAV
jgi:hypothetical protein